MAHAASTLGTNAIFLRSTYFAWRPAPPPGQDQPFVREVRQPNLLDVERALAQTRLLFRSAAVIALSSTRGTGPVITVLEGGPDVSPLLTAEPRIVELRMTSPLEVLLEIPPYWYPVLGGSLLLLAERICTFGPRVSAARKRSLLEAAVWDAERKRVAEGQADALAQLLLDQGPERDGPRGPDYLDVLDPTQRVRLRRSRPEANERRTRTG